MGNAATSYAETSYAAPRFTISTTNTLVSLALQLAMLTPLPVLLSKKLKIEKKEGKWRTNVEGRAKKWEEESKVLGHEFKRDVKKPRAQIAIPVLKKEKGVGDDEEEKLRVEIWNARTR